jgi:starch synthase
VKIAIVAAEIGPHAKAGGLADVVGALPQALKKAGADPCVIVPGYKALLAKYRAQEVSGDYSLDLADKTERFKILRAEIAPGVPLFMIDHPEFFRRDGIYGEKGADYPDNLRRFIFFGRAAAIAAASIHPDVIHSHDWHTAVAPIVMRADANLRESFAGTTSVFTIHNLAFQGIFEASDFPMLGIDWSWFSIDCLEFYGRVNLMKGAVVLSDGASTVSPTYAHEISHDPELGFGMEGVLRAKGERFVGILNGADYDEWDPAKDQFISTRFSPTRRNGKKACLYDLREELNLPHRLGTPVAGMVTRMTPQKGIDILAGALDEIMRSNVQLVMLASGDPKLEAFFKDAEQRYPENLRVVLSFDNRLAHRIQAGSDIFVMPSKFEPCGLTQMYALKYGTAPVVRSTGGLKDTVVDFDAASGKGNGFSFAAYEPAALAGTIGRAASTFRNPPQWQRLMDNCFKADFSWDRAAREYIDWFGRIRRDRAAA